jgi:glycosyltransferase involved in cell wall biosynthesis
METVLTIRKAISIRKSYDIIQVRDGEPFIFIPFVFSIPYKNIKWNISLTAAIVFKPKVTLMDFIRRPFVYLYSKALYLWVNNPMWRLLYLVSLRRTRFVLTPQNEIATKAYKEYLGGIFKHNVVCVELGVDRRCYIIDKSVAREKLGVPQDAFVVLSFGAPHSGKNMDIIFQSVRDIGSVYLLHGGTHTFSLGSNPIVLMEKYNVKDRVKLYNRYVPDIEHPYFFCAADVIVLSYTKEFASTSSTLWESSKYKLPVVSSNANTLGEDVKKFGLGLLFDADDVKSLTETLVTYINLDDSIIQRMKRNCDKYVEEHLDDKWVGKCLTVYRRLLDG